MRYGPVLSGVLNLINEGSPEEDGQWSQLISVPDGHSVRLQVQAVPTDELSRAEERLLDGTFAKYGHMNRWNLVEMLHSLGEWQDPNGRAIPIRYSDILKAGGKTEQEIAAFVAELRSLNASELLVQSH
jgi:hypothetical protein